MNKSISELDAADQIGQDDILLVSQKTANGYTSKKVLASNFKGAAGESGLPAIEAFRAEQTKVNANLQTSINSVSGGYFKAFDTLANLQAATGMTAGQVAKVMNDATTSNNGDYRYNGTAWVKGYDALTDAKTFTKNTVDKSSQLNGWFDPSFTQINLVDKSYFGRERWWNSYAGWSKVKNTFFNGYALRRADGYNQTTFGGFTTYLDEMGLSAGDELTAYVLCVGNASTVHSGIRFHDASGAVIGTTQLMTNEAGADNLITSLTVPKWLRKTLTIPANAVKVVVYPYNFSGSVGFDVVAHWVAAGDQANVSEQPLFHSVYQSLKNNDLDKKSLPNYEVYLNLKHDTEKVGNTAYKNILKMGGFYEIAVKSGYINSIQCRIWKTVASDVEVRIFVRGASESGVFNPSLVTPKQSLTISAANFPSSETDLTIALTTPIYANAGERVYVLFRAVDGGAFNVKTWAYDATANPARHGFALSTVSDWSQAFSLTGAAIGYGQTSMSLTYSTGEFEAKAKAENIKYGSGSVKEALDQLTTQGQILELIVPPKIYATQGLESNIYFDNLVAGQGSDYLFDVDSAIGVHQKERWTLSPTAAANTPITVKAHLKDGVQIASKQATLVATAASDNPSTKTMLIVGDSLIAAGVITQTLLDNAASNVTKINLIGTQGTGSNKHEGRGGWAVNNYTTAGVTYYAFTVSGVTTEPLINATEYTHNGRTYRVQSVSLSSGSGTIICSVVSGTNAPLSSGTLTKSNAIQGDATIAFSASAAQSGNPFWFNGGVDFGQYLSTNSLATPDVVAIMLGVNDVFGQTSDSAASLLADSRLTSLDTLINSIKSVNSTIKVALMIPPPPASQDAFGKNYASGETAWRHKRNIVIWARQMIAKYSNQESNRIYLVATNVAIDTVNNYPAESVAVNARNSATVTRQSNGVHPANSGYQQIADQLFAFIKAV